MSDAADGLYSWRPLNLVLLVAALVGVVLLWGGSLADFSTLLGSTSDRASSRLYRAAAARANGRVASLQHVVLPAGSGCNDGELGAAGIG